MKKIVSLILVMVLALQVGFAVESDSLKNKRLKSVEDSLNKTYPGAIGSYIHKDTGKEIPNPLEATFVTEVFDNGDGTYSYYVNSNTHFKQPAPALPFDIPGMPKNTYPKVTKDDETGKIYHVGKDGFNLVYDEQRMDTWPSKFTGTMVPNPEIEIISANIVDSDKNDKSTVKIVEENGKKVVKWDYSTINDIKIAMLKWEKVKKREGFPPKDVIDPNTGKPVIEDKPYFIEISPRQTLKVVVKPKKGIAGNILPFKKLTSVSDKSLQGSNAKEFLSEYAFMRGFKVSEPKLAIETNFYDKQFKNKIEKTQIDATVGVEYKIQNKSKVDVINFVQNLNIKDVTINGKKHDDLTKGKAIDIDKLSNVKEVVVRGTLIVKNKVEKAVGTAKIGYKDSTNKLPKTHVLGSGKYFRYLSKEIIDEDYPLPALEGQSIIAVLDPAKDPDYETNKKYNEAIEKRIYGFLDRSENGYKPGIAAFDTDYLYNGTNTLIDKEVVVTDPDTLKVELRTTRWVELGNENHVFKKDVTDKEFKVKEEKFEENGFTYEYVETKDSDDKLVRTHYYTMKAAPLTPAEKKVTTRWVELGNENHVFKKDVTDKEFKVKEEKFEENGFTYEYVETKDSDDKLVRTHYYAMKAVPLTPAEKKVTTRWVELGNEKHVFKKAVTDKEFKVKEDKFEENGFTYEYVETKDSDDKLVRTHYYTMKAAPLTPAEKKVITRWVEKGNEKNILKEEVTDKEFKEKILTLTKDGKTYKWVEKITNGNIRTHYYVLEKTDPVKKEELPATGQGSSVVYIVLGITLLLGGVAIAIKTKKSK